jgi:hypothetical protein
MPTLRSPSDTEVVSTLNSLLGRDVQAAKIAPPGALGDAARYLAVYTLDDGTVCGLAVCDLKLAASAGVALAIMPPRRIEECVKAGSLEDDILDNLREILNVTAGILNGTGHPHVVFQDVLGPNPQPTPAVEALLAQPAFRLDLEVTIAGYNGGKISFLLS